MSARDYIEYIYLDHLLSGDFDESCGGGWLTERVMRKKFHEAIRDAFKYYGIDVGDRYGDVANAVYEKLENDSILQVEGDEIVGSYRKFSVGAKDDYIKKLIATNPVSSRIGKLGESVLSTAVENLSDSEGWGVADGGSSSDTDEVSPGENRQAPAADRVVTFSDNQIGEIEHMTTEVINAVAGQNRIDDEPGAREIILGQLKAGRELVRAGSFKLYFIQLTLLDTLRFLATRYEKEAIGGLAAALITALVKHLGIDA